MNQTPIQWTDLVNEILEDPFNWLCLILGVLALGCAVAAAVRLSKILRHNKKGLTR